MTAPKVTVVVFSGYFAGRRQFDVYVGGEGCAYRNASLRMALARLAQSGQVLDIPDNVQPGWFGIPTDKPGLPHGEWWGNVQASTTAPYIYWYTCHPGNVKRLGLLRFWIDDDGPHVEVVE